MREQGRTSGLQERLADEQERSEAFESDLQASQQRGHKLQVRCSVACMHAGLAAAQAEAAGARRLAVCMPVVRCPRTP